MVRKLAAAALILISAAGFAQGASLSRAQALRQAMLHVMLSETGKDRAGKPLFSYAHPLFWAPFSLVGDGN